MATSESSFLFPSTTNWTESVNQLLKEANSVAYTGLIPEVCKFHFFTNCGINADTVKGRHINYFTGLCSCANDYYSWSECPVIFHLCRTWFVSRFPQVGDAPAWERRRECELTLCRRSLRALSSSLRMVNERLYRGFQHQSFHLAPTSYSFVGNSITK